MAKVDKPVLLEVIQDAAAEYACDYHDEEFEVVVRIKCKDGYCVANFENEQPK